MKSSDVVARTALTAVLTAAAFWSPAALAAEPTATEYRFAVYYGDRRIGEHRYEIVQDGDATRVRSRADFQVKLLFINAYRYEHQANELWRGGCLTGLRSVTDDNGRRYEVDARPRETGLVLTRHAPERAQVTLDADCPASFAYWDRERLGRDRLINSQNGEAVAARLEARGTDTVDGVDARRYRLETDGLAPIDLWYDASDDTWLRLETTREGATLRYRLQEVTRRTAEAIEPDQGTPEPPGV